jgi:chromosomal replication initiation ATPase DnaA
MGTYLEELAAARRKRLARMQDAAKPVDVAVKRDDMAVLSARLSAVEKQLAQLRHQSPKQTANESTRPNSMVATIRQAICRDHAITLTDLEGPSLCPALVEARQVAMYLCRKLAALSYQEIACHFGNRSHTAALHAYGKIDRRRIDDEKLDRQLLELEQRIRSTCSSDS